MGSTLYLVLWLLFECDARSITSPLLAGEAHIKDISRNKRLRALWTQDLQADHRASCSPNPLHRRNHNQPGELHRPHREIKLPATSHSKLHNTESRQRAKDNSPHRRQPCREPHTHSQQELPTTTGQCSGLGEVRVRTEFPKTQYHNRPIALRLSQSATMGLSENKYSTGRHHYRRLFGFKPQSINKPNAVRSSTYCGQIKSPHYCNDPRPRSSLPKRS